MVFTDQMLEPRKVIPVPKDLAPPRIDLSYEDESYEHELLAGLPMSPLGVWRIDGCKKFLEIVEKVLAFSSTKDTCDSYKNDDLYEKIVQLVKIGDVQGNLTNARGRRNLNLKAVPPMGKYVIQDSTTDAETDMVRQLQEQTAKLAKQVSRCMEVWLALPKGSMQCAHERGLSSSLRLLDYPAGVSVPPHTDGSAYTLVYNKSSMMVQSPSDDDIWYEIPPNQNSHSLLLLLGSHLDQAIPSRLQRLGRVDSSHCILRAPVHRLSESNTPRRAMTLHVKADIMWPPVLENLNKSNHKKKDEGNLTAADYHDRDISWDAELFSQYLFSKYVPSVEDVLDHLKLLVSIVTGSEYSLNTKSQKGATSCPTFDSVSSSPSFVTVDPTGSKNEKSFVYRLPSVHCRGYWQLQTQRYRTFLKIHRLYPLKAAGMLPPRQIHHVWLCHQLHPLNYKVDCQKWLGGRILSHKNSDFCLQGCSKFHELWKVETGAPWPSLVELQQEVEEAKSMKEISPNDDCLDIISANLWHNYDGLSRLYCELQKETPRLFDFESKYANSLINEARQDYARFLIASSYASIIGFQVTPSGLVDLVWHTHQTNPQAYDDVNQKEFQEAPINHVPCGALNPPPNDGKSWLEMTDKIWVDLYGHGLNVQGRAIHCCTPAPPTNVEFFPNVHEVRWWFPSPRVSSAENFSRGFPVQRRIITGMANQLFVENLNVDELLEHVIQPLLVAILDAFQTHKEDLQTHFSCGRKLCCTIPYLSIIAYAGWFSWTKNNCCEVQGLLAIPLMFCFICHACYIDVTHDKYEKKLWDRIKSLVESFNSLSIEHGIKIMFRKHVEGPLDTNNPGNKLYKGPAIVFVRNDQNVR